MKSQITAVILTKNEEKNIERALKSVQFCDEIIVIDDDSTDKTASIAQKYTKKIFNRSLNNDFASQRNFGMQKANNEWILFVDADEEVTEELQKEIISVSATTDAYFLKRRDFFYGREMKHGEIQKVREQGIIRLVQKGAGEWQGTVHETFSVKGKTGTLQNFINHYPHQTIKDFLNDINGYSTIRARELYDAQTASSLFQMIAYPIGKFLDSYFLKQGFLDGPEGFIYSFMMSFHSYLVRAKLYQLHEIQS